MDNFDWNFYTKYYKDLSKFNKNEAREHYLQYGIYEKRFINLHQIGFNWIFYTTYYPDLRLLTNESQAISHYLSSGKDENRFINEEQINFNWIFYTNYYPDLNIFTNESQAISHYLSSGKNEKRFINQEQINFNWLFYKNFNRDLNHFNESESYRHWALTGYKENRLKNYTESDFDWRYYTWVNKDLLHFNKKEATSHWIKAGILENREYKECHYLRDIYQSKTLVIYCYKEKNKFSNNQTNLSFFINYGLSDDNWKKTDITYLFVIINKQCEVLIPSKKNIVVLKIENCSDLEGWYNGINYMNQINEEPIWETYDYLCLINCSAFGPIYQENNNTHWLEPFYNQMVKFNSILCSPYTTFVKNDNPSEKGPRNTQIFSLIKISKNIIVSLNENIISTIDKSSNNSNQNIEYPNTTLKKDETNDLLKGEYKLSKFFLEKGFNISCLLYDFNICDPQYFNYNENMHPDRYNSFFGKNMPLSTIFVKNIFNYEKGYLSLPVNYKECKIYYEKKRNLKNIFSNKINDFQYEYIDYLPKLEKPFQNPNWYSKEEFYNFYGEAEEILIFRKPIKKQYGCAIYAHYDNENIIKDYVIQGLKVLHYIGYDILFYTASDSINNYDINMFPFKTFFIKNSGVGTDWKIWLEGLNYIKNKNLYYDWIFTINDSILFPINGIKKFTKTIDNMRKSSDFWGHWCSPEVTWHIIGTPLEFKYSVIDYVINFVSEKIGQCKSDIDYIILLETKLTEFISKRFKIKTVIKELKDIIPIDKGPFFPQKLAAWINNPKSFAIKWKYNISYLSPNEISPYCNYLARYLYYGPNGYISKAEKNGSFESSKKFYLDKYDINTN